jgi:diguanylate cyclase (GGDEF)-like protein
MVLFVWTMGVAKRRGSRAVNYQIAAWTPVMVTAAVRILSALGATDAPIEMLVAQHYALGLEVVLTSLGVFDRLVTIRHQRDIAMADLRIFEDRAERDPLTGLLNRRAIEKRFEELHAQGFRAMAVIDLDKFKSVNDTHGHVTGDAVLRAVAEALEPDTDTLAIRMGGEEFLLLLRGKDVANRAERRRQAIAVRTAAKVPGLDRVVTASMGMVELPAGSAIHADFKTLYGHCDRLLYEAKNTGRNRTMREKMQIFGTGKPARAA